MERFIDVETAKTLKEHFSHDLKRDVVLDIYTDQKDEYAQFTVGFTSELGELSDKIKPVIHPFDEGQKMGLPTDPSLKIGQNLGFDVKFNGTPAGYEANTLIETIKALSKKDGGLNVNYWKALQEIDRPVHLQVFVTPTCPYCPKSASMAARFTTANPSFISVEIVEASENMELSAKYNVTTVPQTIINGDPESSLVGVQTEKTLITSMLRLGTADPDEVITRVFPDTKPAKDLEDNPNHTVHIDDQNFEAALKKYPKLIIDCWAEWCGPCRQMLPVVEALAEKYSGRVAIGKLNTDENPHFSNHNRIESIPSLLFYRDGELIEKQIGALSKSELEEMMQTIFKLIA